MLFQKTVYNGNFVCYEWCVNKPNGTLKLTDPLRRTVMLIFDNSFALHSDIFLKSRILPVRGGIMTWRVILPQNGKTMVLIK